MKLTLLRLPPPLFFILLPAVQSARGQVVNKEWNTGNGSWNVPANWSPSGVPANGGGTTYTVQIGNRAVAANAQVTLVPVSGTSDTVSSLTLSGGADFLTAGAQLVVTGQTTLSSAASALRVDPYTGGTAAFQTLDFDLNNGSTLSMNGGIFTVPGSMENNSSTISGFGTINVGDGDAGVEQVFENSGTIDALGPATVPGTLTLHANGVDTLDLDGDSENGVVRAFNALADVKPDTQTLVVDGPLADAFGGTIQIGQRDTVKFTRDFTMTGGAAVQMDGGNFTATLEGPGNMTSIAGTAFNITGDAVIENGMAFTGTANIVTVAANSSLRLNGTVSIPDASALSLAGSSELIVAGNVSISEPAGDFNWDGPGTATTTVQGTGHLALHVNRVDTTTADNYFGGTLNLNDDGDLSVDVAGVVAGSDGAWGVTGTLNKNNGGSSEITGDHFGIGGAVHVNAGILTLPSDVTLAKVSVANPDVTVNGELRLFRTVVHTPASITGTGIVRLDGPLLVQDDLVISVNTFDWNWDGPGLDAGLIQIYGDHLTINAPVLGHGEALTNDIAMSNGSRLTINGPAEWTMDGELRTGNSPGDATTIIDGTSRLIMINEMTVDGNTNIDCPLTLGAGSTVLISEEGRLNTNGDAVYAGGTVSGAGTLQVSPLNTVTTDSTINTAGLEFDSGNWVVQNDAELTINVTDYDGTVSNVFGAEITLNDGDISVTTGDAEFVMDGVLNMVASTPTKFTVWNGEPIDIGNDAGALDADVNVSGPGICRFEAAVDFNSDADVNIAAGATLDFMGTVNFDTVNGASNGRFTGPGRMTFHDGVNVHEAATLNLTGGTVDLDGNDAVGDFINVDAPLTIQAQSLTSFGRNNSGGGVNTLDINNNVGTGVLTVTLENAASEWTLNSSGVINLVNDNAATVLLAGNGVNVNGTMNVIGAVRTDARLDIAGTVNINTFGESFVLNGGDSGGAPNTIAGGVINGPGRLSASAGRSLRGAGTIHAPVSFPANTALLASGGTLALTSPILAAATVGTFEAGGILDVPSAWNTVATQLVQLNGGELRGGAITVGNTNGIQGQGFVSARVINNTKIAATAGTLIFQTSLNDNDWDGTTNTGQLQASGGGTLELRDTGLFSLAGTVVATGGGRVFSNGFAFNFNPGSSLQLTAGTYESGSTTFIGGNVTAGAGTASTISLPGSFSLTFQSTSVTTLNGPLRVQNINTYIAPGAAFSGTGALIVAPGAQVSPQAGANINVLLENQGILQPGEANQIGSVNLQAYQQTARGELFMEVTGTGGAQLDRLVITGGAQLGGHLDLDIDGAFVPSVGQTFDIITATGGVTGTFGVVTATGMPAGLGFTVGYLPNTVRVTVAAVTPFDMWMDAKVLEAQAAGMTINAADLARNADKDGDGVNNLGEFALNGHPFKGDAPDKAFPQIAPVSGSNALTITIPVRNAAVVDAADPAGGELVLKQTADVLTYRVQAGDVLNNTWTLDAAEVTGADASAIRAGLPVLDAGWSYRTFRSPGAVAGDPREYMRVVITE